MSDAPTRVFVERFLAFGHQQVGCGHTVVRGGTVVELVFGGGDVVARSITTCEGCFAAIGRLGRGDP